MPLYANLCGMSSMGFAESGNLDRAEEMGMAALQMDPQDGWALRSCVHVCGLAGRAHDGKRLLRETEDDWVGSTRLEHHLRWQRMLLQSEEGDVRGSMALYDSGLGPWAGRTPADDIDDVSMLWRTDLQEHPATREHQGGDGRELGPLAPSAPLPNSVIVGCGLREALNSTGSSRWEEVAARCKRHVGVHSSVLLDVHIAMGLAACAAVGGAGSNNATCALESHLSSMMAYAHAGSPRSSFASPINKSAFIPFGDLAPFSPCHSFSVSSVGGRRELHADYIDNRLATLVFGVPVARGVAAFAAGDYAAASDALLSTRSGWSHLGGSSAQRDTLELTLIHALLRTPDAKDRGLGAALCSERVSRMPQSPQAWGLFAAAQHGLGRLDRAADARNRAYVLGLNQGPQY